MGTRDTASQGGDAILAPLSQTGLTERSLLELNTFITMDHIPSGTKLGLFWSSKASLQVYTLLEESLHIFMLRPHFTAILSPLLWHTKLLPYRNKYLDNIPLPPPLYPCNFRQDEGSVTCPSWLNIKYLCPIHTHGLLLFVIRAGIDFILGKLTKPLSNMRKQTH